MQPIIQAKHMIKKYPLGGQKTLLALNHIDLEAYQGDFIAIMGPSGSGKTTLLNCLSTIDALTTGTLAILGKNLSMTSQYRLNEFRYQHLGYLFQDYHLMNNLTNYENIEIPLLMHRVNAKKRKRYVRDSAAKLGILPILEQYPEQCSGGQQQRVALARALVNQPDLLFADEPTGNLDSQTAKDLMALFQKLNAMGTTILMVTHSCEMASYAKKVLYLHDGEITHELNKANLSKEAFYQQILTINLLDEFTKE